jgi:integrase
MFLWLATTTGARRGELAALRWSRIDVTAGLIRIETNYVVRGGQRQEKETKTDSDRRLALDPLTVQMLADFRAQRAAQLAPAHCDLAEDAFVFSPDPAGLRPWHPDHFSHAYRELTDILGIGEPLKNLRHFNATQLLAAGVDLRTTAGRLGHSDGGATTLKVYADWMPATDRRAAEQLSADLTALRAAHAARGSQAVEPMAAPLRRVARPLDEILEPAVDGRTTSLRGSVGPSRVPAGGPHQGGVRGATVGPKTSTCAGWVGPGRPARVTPGGFPRPARRTRRAVSTQRALHVSCQLVSRWRRLPGPTPTGSVSCCRDSGSASPRR